MGNPVEYLSLNMFIQEFMVHMMMYDKVFVVSVTSGKEVFDRVEVDKMILRTYGDEEVLELEGLGSESIEHLGCCTYSHFPSVVELEEGMNGLLQMWETTSTQDY